jgi:O-antigen/teichoic acid export membrane protein
MLRTIILVLAGNASSSILLFARNLLVARLLSVDDYGIASAFALAMTAAEMAVGVGLQEFLVQNRRGDDAELLAGVHSFSLLRGLLSSLALLALAGPTSAFFGVEHVAWAFRLLALTPFLKGLEHFDLWRLARASNFRPLMYTRILSSFASIISVGPFYFIFGDFRIALGAIFIQAGTSLALSHLFSERRYGLTFDGSIYRNILSFGWPILINSFLMFLVFQGDRVIVGRFFGIQEFALFSMGVTLILTPSLVVAGSEQQFFLPLLSSKREEKGTFTDHVAAVVQTSFISSILLCLALVLVMPTVAGVLLGEKYHPLFVLLTPLAIQFSVRNLKVGCTIAAISIGRTGNALLSNLARLLFFPVAWFVIERGGSIIDLVWISAAGEVFGFLVSIGLLLRYAHILPSVLILPTTLVLLVFAQSALYYSFGGGFYIAGIGAATLGAFYFSYEFRRLILANLWRSLGDI